MEVKTIVMHLKDPLRAVLCLQNNKPCTPGLQWGECFDAGICNVSPDSRPESCEFHEQAIQMAFSLPSVN